MENYHTHCLLCKSSQLVSLKGYEESHLCKCEKCSFVFAQKIPSEQELIDHYQQYGRNDYLSPVTVKRYNELLTEFEKYRKTNKLLDVGCGIGYFLEVAKERGWEVYGTEYTKEAINICENKGIAMKQGKLNPHDFNGMKFDIITSFEVIEHINNPIEEITNFKQLLREGGLVYATTPNFNSLLRYRFKEKYNAIGYPEHLSYYTPKTIAKLFRSLGYQKIKIVTTGISLTRLKGSREQKEIKYIAENTQDEILRTKMEEKWYFKIIKSVLNFFLTIFGIGDSLKIWYVKK